MKIRHFVLTTMFCILLIQDIHPSSIKYSIISPPEVKQLSDQWLVYDAKYDCHIPYIPSVHKQVTNICLWLYASQDYNYTLKFVTAPNLSVYLNQQLFFIYNTTDTVKIELKPLFKKLNKAKILLTIYQPSGNLTWQTFSIINTNVSNTKIVNIPDNQSVARKINTLIKDYYLISFLFIIGLYISIRNLAPKSFTWLLDLRNFFPSEISDNGNLSKNAWNPFTISVIIANCFQIAFLGVLLSNNEFLEGKLSNNIYELHRGSDWFISLIEFFCIAFLYHIFKYILIIASGFFFNISKVGGIHFIEFIRFNTIACIMLSFLSMMTYGSGLISVSVFFNLLKLVLFGMFLLRIFKISITLNKSAGFKNLYLFSYLCVTEIIPLAIIAKLFLG